MNNSVAANVTVQEIHLPQMMTIKQVSELAQMPPYYKIGRASCRERV